MLQEAFRRLEANSKYFVATGRIPALERDYLIALKDIVLQEMDEILETDPSYTWADYVVDSVFQGRLFEIDRAAVDLRNRQHLVRKVWGNHHS